MSRLWLLTLLLGCGGSTVTGAVVDVTGAPVAEAAVTNISGRLCTAESGMDGRFELACGGDMKLAVVKDGWLTEEIVVGESTDLGEIRLVKTEPDMGLWLYGRSGWEPLVGSNEAVQDRGAGVRTHTLVRDGHKPLHLPAGKLVWMDSSHDGWRLFTVQDDDRIHVARKGDDDRWRTELGEQPETTKEDVEGLRKLVHLELAPGDYFLADWQRGGFVRKKKDEQRVSGRWLHVE